MAFDPDQYLALAKAKGPLRSGLVPQSQEPQEPPEAIKAPPFDPDAYLAARKPAPEPSLKDRLLGSAPLGQQVVDSFKAVPGEINAAVRGAAEAATLNTAPAIAGGLSAAGKLLTGDTNLAANYRAGRDAYKAEDKRTATENPISSTAGSVGGALLGGLAGAGKTAAQRILLGAGEAAVAGAAGSEGDLTKGEVGKVATDAAIGGGLGLGVGAAAHGLEAGAQALAQTRAAKWAAERMQQIRLGGLLSGLSKPQKLAVLGAEGENTAAVNEVLQRNQQLAAAAEKNPEKALGLVREQMKLAGEDVGQIFDHAQAVSPGVHFGRAERNLTALRNDLARNTADESLANQVDGVIDSFAKKYGTRTLPASGLEVEGRIPFDRMRDEYRSWQDLAYQAGKARKANQQLSPKQEVAEGVAKALRGALYDELEAASAASPGAQPLRQLLEAENHRLSTLHRVEDALIERTAGDTAQAGAESASKFVRHAAQEVVMPALLGGGVAALAGGNENRGEKELGAALAALAFKRVGPGALRGLETSAARRVLAARAAQAAGTTATSPGVSEALLRALQTTPRPILGGDGQ